MPTIKLDPVTRLEGHMKIEVEVDGNNRVTSAKSTGNMFRGFESLLLRRDPRDAVHITQRICGFCPVSHAMASVKAIESAENYKPKQQGKFLRNLIQGANYLSNHILHFYHLTVPDFVAGPNKTLWKSSTLNDLRFSQKASDDIFANYVKALEMRRKAHEMAALFAGKIPHVMSIMPGGVTKTPTAQEIATYKQLLLEVKAFIENEYAQDVQKLASVYKDYFQVGIGYGNFISFGVFDVEDDKQLFRSGRYTDQQLFEVDPYKITEDVKYAWYTDASGNPNESFILGSVEPEMNKSGAYTWTKAPRYLGKAHEAGPLARMWLNGDYRQGVSVMDRHVARMLEAKKIAHAMVRWVDNLRAEGQTDALDYNDALHTLSAAKKMGVGLTEAPRGALVHFVSYENNTVNKYEIVTPTCWNASPKDSADLPGPIELALTGVQIADTSKPVELMRIIHSFDPCTACAVHVMTPEKQIASQFIVSPL
ncbi:hypothetical protein BHU72_06960 [Desulfuribacillus stibiiarsenatis]|uniref:Ni,Fe-hydrogenase I large subunit n=1 Tax=Desulfuribacillus stibiiarsenatis TaxID=1390249 RepID=A0A1E5L484_9FIRM|nr:nickel-dependent hydrogenase large subunit [Desulfuribacillus stibiiarsenatis]OEH84925.1 hypothetical protein BHU72_06960 [Desulfuribacillus stibiiarsenatis]